MKQLKTSAGKVWKWTVKHKWRTAIAVIAVFYAVYYAYGAFMGKNSASVRYVMAQVGKGTVISSVTATGQVSASNQLDIKPQVSGNIVAVGAIAGKQVRTGAPLFEIDSTDAQKAVRDAEISLESAQLSLAKLKEPPTALALTQAENSLTQARQSQINAADELTKSYADGFDTVANSFLDMPSVMTGLDDILNNSTVNGTQQNAYAYYDLIKKYQDNADQFRDQALAAYQTAKTAFDKNLADYKSVTRYSDRATIDALISETYNTVGLISEAVKDAKSFLDLVNDTYTSGVMAGSRTSSKPPAVLATHETNLTNYTGTMTTVSGNLLNITNTIKSDKDTISNASGTILAEQQSLEQLKAGPDPLDVQSAELSVKQKDNALLDARETLAEYSVRAPFAGVVAQVNFKKGDSASPGSALATMITEQKIADVSLNEVDVAKISLAEQATLTFDALPDLKIAGKVIQIDTIGTVSQGVVTYNVEIGFDTQDSRVKPGMSVTAAIITDAKQNVLTVPNSAIKTQGNTQYVEILSDLSSTTLLYANQNQGITSAVPPAKQIVETGITDGSVTEITGGLKEGDFVVTRTISTSTAAQSQTNSGLRVPGVGGGGFGGGVRIGGGGFRGD